MYKREQKEKTSRGKPFLLYVRPPGLALFFKRFDLPLAMVGLKIRRGPEAYVKSRNSFCHQDFSFSITVCSSAMWVIERKGIPMAKRISISHASFFSNFHSQQRKEFGN